MENGAGGSILFQRFATLHCQQVDFLLCRSGGRKIPCALYDTIMTWNDIYV